jgi:hypothetical protein
MVSFQTQNPTLGKLWWAQGVADPKKNFDGPYIDWKMLKYFMAIWNIYRHLGYFMTIWYILCSFGTFCVHLVHFSRFG